VSARACLILCFALLLIGCGVKNDLEIPSGRPPAADERDPSRPPQPLGQ
jgi:hypothetical protein